jgi:hypothetical protein
MMQHRHITHRTRGRRHGPVVRLMSPSDLGEIIKPFVFLDLFHADMGLKPLGVRGVSTGVLITARCVDYIAN